MGRDILENKNYETAIYVFSRVIALDPENAQAYFWRAWAYMNNLENLNKANDDSFKAQALDEHWTDPAYLQGKILDAMAELSESSNTKKEFLEGARNSLTVAIARNPNYVRAFLLRGNEYLSEGKFDQALSDYNEALRLANSDTAYYDQFYPDIKNPRRRAAGY